MLIAKVMSDREDDTFYTVERDCNGHWTCTCPHHVYRHRLCKHISKTKCVLGNHVKIEGVFLAEEFEF